MGNICRNKGPPETVIYSDSQKKKPKNLKSGLDDDPDIFIIGAGIAGLACALELKKSGFKNVHILEASNNIGGRISTAPFGENVVDLGAQWVHGQAKNTVYEIVYDQNVLDATNNVYAKVDWVRSNGTKLSPGIVSCLMNKLSEIWHTRFEDLHQYDGSFNNYLYDKLMVALQNDDDNNIEDQDLFEFFNAYVKMRGSESGTGLNDELSAKGFEAYRECKGNPMLCWKNRGSFEQFLKLFLNMTPSTRFGDLEGSIELNSRVIKVEWDNSDGRVYLTCTNKKNYSADHVVITVPLGFLKKNIGTFFKPNLPAYKRRAVNYIGYGHICKIFMLFHSPFWSKEWQGFTAVWLSNDNSTLKYKNLSWLGNVIGFYRLEYQPMVLQGWACGEYVEYIETLDNQELTNGLIYMLNRFLPKIKIHGSIQVVTSKWTSSENFLGAYSYPSILTEQNHTSPAELMQPVNVLAYIPDASNASSESSSHPMTVRPVLLFAGEATSAHHFATVHGALDSGRREAQRLAGYYFK